MGVKDLPQAGGERHAKTFERFGWVRAKRRRNTHIILRKEGCRATLAIPNHKGKDVKRVLIAKLIKAAEISESDYCDRFK